MSARAKELIAGYWVIEVASKQEALAWALRVPFEDGEVEVRQIFETADFPAEVLPPQEVAREQAMQEKLRSKAGR